MNENIPFGHLGIRCSRMKMSLHSQPYGNITYVTLPKSKFCRCRRHGDIFDCIRFMSFHKRTSNFNRNFNKKCGHCVLFYQIILYRRNQQSIHPFLSMFETMQNEVYKYWDPRHLYSILKTLGNHGIHSAYIPMALMDVNNFYKHSHTQSNQILHNSDDNYEINWIWHKNDYFVNAYIKPTLTLDNTMIQNIMCSLLKWYFLYEGSAVSWYYKNTNQSEKDCITQFIKQTENNFITL